MPSLPATNNSFFMDIIEEATLMGMVLYVKYVQFRL